MTGPPSRRLYVLMVLPAPHISHQRPNLPIYEFTLCKPEKETDSIQSVSRDLHVPTLKHTNSYRNKSVWGLTFGIDISCQFSLNFKESVSYV